MERKTQQGMLRKSLVGLGFLLVMALALRHLRTPVTSEREDKTGLAATEPMAAGRGGESYGIQPQVSLPTRTDLPPPGSAATPFLRALVRALESIANVKDRDQQEDRLESLAKSIPPAELPVAVSFLLEPDASDLHQELGLRLIRLWTSSDPSAVSEWLDQRPPGTVSQDAIKEVATVWANEDLSAAVEWARRLTEGPDRQTGLRNVAYEAARTKPIEAITLSMELPADQSRDDLITHSALQWAAVDPRGAAEWARQIDSEGLRDRILSGIAAVWGGTDPNAAATLAVKSVSAGRAQDDAVVGIAQRWVQKEPENAAAWVAQFPNGILRDTALENLVSLWADKDPTQAGNWLNVAGLGASQDTAVSVYVSKIAPAFPEAAAHWAETIEDDGLRAREMERVGEAWMISDAKAARAWIAEGAMSPVSKQRLLDPAAQ